jgi:hypothetical protein
LLNVTHARRYSTCCNASVRQTGIQSAARLLKASIRQRHDVIGFIAQSA